jgi:hypothetical protein
MLPVLLHSPWLSLPAATGGSYGDFCSCCCAAGPIVGLVIMLLFMLFGVIGMFGAYMVFEKAGEPGWAALVPIYSLIIMAKIAGWPDNQWLIVFIPFYGWFRLASDLARAFGKEAGFVILLFLPVTAWMGFAILGFGDAKYRLKRKKPRRDDFDDDVDDRPSRGSKRRREDLEDEDDPPRRPPRRRRDGE